MASPIYQPTWESVGAHALPQWYDDAKLGVFLHWGSIRFGWAPQVPDIQRLLKEKGPAEMLRTTHMLSGTSTPAD